MGRFSKKIVTLKQQEEFNRKVNTYRRIFWEDTLKMYLILKDILELKKEENPDIVADNSSLDEKLFEKVGDFAAIAAPTIIPFIADKINEQIEQTIALQNLDTNKPN